MGSSTEITEGKAGAQSSEARDALRKLGIVGDQGMQQMGDMSGIASGNLRLTPEQIQYLQQAQQASGDMGRIQMDENMETAKRQVEDTAIGQNMTGGSFEAINMALLGQQQQRDANRSTLQGQGQMAQDMVNMPLQYGQLAVEGNKALLDRLVAGSGQTLQYDAGMRELNQTQTKTTQDSFGSQLAGLAGQVGSAWATGGLSALIQPGEKDETG